jgi:hypothetical protein
LKGTLFLISPPAGGAGIKELRWPDRVLQLDLYAYTLLATVGRPVWKSTQVLCDGCRRINSN